MSWRTVLKRLLGTGGAGTVLVEGDGGAGKRLPTELALGTLLAGVGVVAQIVCHRVQGVAVGQYVELTRDEACEFFAEQAQIKRHVQRTPLPLINQVNGFDALWNQPASGQVLDVEGLAIFVANTPVRLLLEQAGGSKRGGVAHFENMVARGLPVDGEPWRQLLGGVKVFFDQPSRIEGPVVQGLPLLVVINAPSGVFLNAFS